MKNILLVLCSLFASHLFAQYKHDYVWLVGNPTEDTTSNNGIDVFDFNQNKLEIIKQSEGLGSFVSNASISNHEGQLLFYSNGCYINNALHETMQNGTGLNPGLAYSTGNCPDYGNATTNGLIILPLPGDSMKYYVFHQAYVFTEALGAFVGKLYYTVVDMEQNNGLGAVVNKNHVILSDTLFSDMHAVRHANGEDWWVIISKNHTNRFYKILFTANGITDTLVQDIGIDPDPFSSGGGQARFSPDGTKYARYHERDQVTLFDFDRSTGELGNFQRLYADTTEGVWGGLAFSSNSRFLYVTTQFKLFQFDLMAPDIQASKTLIDEWDGFTVGGFSVMFFLMQLAPDCKIYMIPVNGSKYMHVIEHPDEPGLACGFKQRGLVLPAINNTSIPNFPNYRLGTGVPFCDSSIVYVSGTGFVPPPVREVRLWPNPASDELHLEVSGNYGQACIFRLFNVTGQLTREWRLEGGQQEQGLNLSGIDSGLYFWQLTTVDGEMLGNGKIVVGK